jgi:hypothetical protein
MPTMLTQLAEELLDLRAEERGFRNALYAMVMPPCCCCCSCCGTSKDR